MVVADVWRRSSSTKRSLALAMLTAEPLVVDVPGKGVVQSLPFSGYTGVRRPRPVRAGFRLQERPVGKAAGSFVCNPALNHARALLIQSCLGALCRLESLVIRALRER